MACHITRRQVERAIQRDREVRESGKRHSRVAEHHTPNIGLPDMYRYSMLS